MHTTPRLIQRGVVCLLIGAVLGVLVAEAAWPYAALRNRPIRRYTVPGDQTVYALARGRFVTTTMRQSPDFMPYGKANLPGEYMQDWIGLPVRTPPMWSVPPVPVEPAFDYATTVTFAVGWPFRTVRCWRTISKRDQLDPVNMVIHDNKVGYVSTPLGAFPARPVWLGLLGNAIFYGVFLLGVWEGLSWLARRNRTRKGRCPWCAYDLRGDLASGCPECGWRRATA